MNSDEAAVGAEATGSTLQKPCDLNTSNDTKRAAVKRLIQSYFTQLTTGCGSPHCDNEYCASSGSLFLFPRLDKNTAAMRALELLKNRSQLCPPLANSVAASSLEGGGVTATHAESGSKVLHPAAVAEAAKHESGGATNRTEHEASTSKFASGMSGVELGGKGSTALAGASRWKKIDEGGTAGGSGGVVGSGSSASLRSLNTGEPLTEKRLIEVIESCEQSAASSATAPWSKLIHLIGQVFLEPDLLMNSFLRRDVSSRPPGGRESRGEEADMEIGEIESRWDAPSPVAVAVVARSKEDMRSVGVDLDKDHDEREFDDDEARERSEEMENAEEPPAEEEEYCCGRGRSAAGGIGSRGSDLEDDDDDDDDVGRGGYSDTAMASVYDHDEEKHLQAISLLPASRPTPVRPSDPDVVDPDALFRAYDRLFSIPDHPFSAALINALIYLMRTLETDLRSGGTVAKRPRYANIYVIALAVPLLDGLEFLEVATPQVCRALGLVGVETQARLAREWAGWEASRVHAMVQRLQQLITVRVITNQWSRSTLVNDDDVITSAAKVLKILYYASVAGGRMDRRDVVSPEQRLLDDAALLEKGPGAFDYGLEHAPNRPQAPPRPDPLATALGVAPSDCRTPLVPFAEFVNESLSDVIEMDKDYTNYKTWEATGGGAAAVGIHGPPKFSFMLHPFLLTTAVKNTGLYYDNRIRMMSERRHSLFQSMMQGVDMGMPYLRLRIRRDHIIDDSLVNLEMIAMDNPQDLKKQLFVEFDGEQGIDEGGVSKEFFQLVVEEIFNPDIAMFTYAEETRTFWFNPTSFENDGQFMLIGIVLGLAIYNNVILDVHLPLVVYRKLMGRLGSFDDLPSSHPVIASSLKQFLEYEGDVAEAFSQPFCVGLTDVFGNTRVHSLKEGGEGIIVTNETRQEFVDLYAHYLLNESVSKQFRAFQRGFQMVTDESPLSMLFYPEEIELLVCGSQNFDFRALEKAAEYDGGFTPESPAIKYFWEVLHEMTLDQQRQLLQFATGSDRVPIGGLSKLKLIIARNGPDSDRLPTSHTCFNVLLLPDYLTKERMRERVLKAITYSKGFGML